MGREPTDPDRGSPWSEIGQLPYLAVVTPPVDRRIFHITDPGAAQRLLADGVLEPPSLDAEGFVHCSSATEVVATTERYYADVDDLVLVELDVGALDAEIRWPEVYPGRRFPHVHGPLTADAVVAVHPWGPGDRAVWEP